MKIFFYSAHSYDRDAFEAVPKPHDYEFMYHAASLEVANAPIAEGCDAICIFVNDNCSAEVIEALHEHGIKVILLRCAGFNNVDLAAAKKYGMFVARVPGIA
jgi:D-lactate dehydrogenase